MFIIGLISISALPSEHHSNQIAVDVFPSFFKFKGQVVERWNTLVIVQMLE